MAATRRSKQGVSVHTFHRGKGQTVRLEYDQKEGKQSVFLNERLTSSFLCPAGSVGIHEFRASDSETDDTGYLGDYKIWVAVEPNSFKIRYHITRRNAGGEDVQWYCYDRNVEPEYWSGARSKADVTDAGNPSCTACGADLVCPECADEDEVVCCESCESALVCPSCDGAGSVACHACGERLVCPKCVLEVSDKVDIGEADDDEDAEDATTRGSIAEERASLDEGDWDNAVKKTEEENA